MVALFLKGNSDLKEKRVELHHRCLGYLHVFVGFVGKECGYRSHFGALLLFFCVDSFFSIFHIGCTLWYFKQVLKYKEMNIVSTYNKESKYFLFFNFLTLRLCHKPSSED